MGSIVVLSGAGEPQVQKDNNHIAASQQMQNASPDHLMPDLPFLPCSYTSRPQLSDHHPQVIRLTHELLGGYDTG